MGLWPGTVPRRTPSTAASRFDIDLAVSVNGVAAQLWTKKSSRLSDGARCGALPFNAWTSTGDGAILGSVSGRARMLNPLVAPPAVLRLREVKTLGPTTPTATTRAHHFFERCGLLPVEETQLGGGTPSLSR